MPLGISMLLAVTGKASSSTSTTVCSLVYYINFLNSSYFLSLISFSIKVSVPRNSWQRTEEEPPVSESFCWMLSFPSSRWNYDTEENGTDTNLGLFPLLVSTLEIAFLYIYICMYERKNFNCCPITE